MNDNGSLKYDITDIAVILYVVYSAPCIRQTQRNLSSELDDLRSQLTL